jgi:uncharacterized membrane protein YkoI
MGYHSESDSTMTRENRTTLAALTLAISLAATALAQGTGLKITEEKPGLLKKAKVAPADAIKTAQAQFPNATIKSGEIEKEGGKLIYTFDIQQAGVKGIEEVNIDAMTGLVIATEHENPSPPKPKTTGPKPAAPKSPAR